MSLYRIGTANTYNATISRINQRTAELAQTQEKLAAGKRVLRATDDPVAATLAERESNRMQRVQADLRALERSRSGLEQAESTLGDAVDVLHRVKELVVQAGNTHLTDSDRASIASELRGLRDQLINLSNAQDSEGNALFGGLGVLNSLGQPFADVYGTTSDVQFQAIGGQAAATDVGLPNRVDGQFTFMRNMTGNGAFVVQHNSGNLNVATGTVVDAGLVSPQVLPLDPAAAVQGRYMLEVSEDASTVPSHLMLNVTRYDKKANVADPDVTAIVQTVDLGEYVSGKAISLSNVSVQFEGLQVTLNGSASPGSELQLNPSEPDDLFATLERAIDAIADTTQSNGGAHLTQELGRVHEELATGLDRVLLVRGKLGEWLQRAETTDSQLQNKKMAHEKAISNLTDLDMVQGFSDFESQQTGLQAALQSYAQVQKLSLFQYIA